MEVSREENKRLVEEYPFLLPRNVFTDDIPEDYDYEYTWLDDMPDEWRKAFAEPMLKELKEILVEGNYLEDYRLQQVKEKYASLHWYSNGIPTAIWDKYCEWEEKYENLSAGTCFYCGEPSKDFTKGWILPICQACLTQKYYDYK